MELASYRSVHSTVRQNNDRSHRRKKKRISCHADTVNTLAELVARKKEDLPKSYGNAVQAQDSVASYISSPSGAGDIGGGSGSGRGSASSMGVESGLGGRESALGVDS